MNLLEIRDRVNPAKILMSLEEDMAYKVFSFQNLKSANLTDLNCKYSRFNDCDLRDALFRNTNLSKAGFYGCDLRDASFLNVNLSGCTLFNLNLKRAQFKISEMFSVDWGHISDDDLAKDCMLYDQEHHPKPELFDKWAKNKDSRTNACPYQHRYVYVQQEINFIPNPEAWLKYKRTKRVRSAYEIMLGLFKEKGIKY